MQAVEPRVHRWTMEEYHQMADLGWFQDRRVELIDGEIMEMPAPRNPHVVSMSVTEDALRAAFGAGFWVRTQSPLNVGPAAEPQPDVAVVTGKPRDYTDHPTTAVLVVEISDATLSYDRNHKGGLYARAAIADYWIVNLINRRLEVYRNPVADAAQPFGFGYSARTTHDPGDVVAPLAAPTAPVAVADLLP